MKHISFFLSILQLIVMLAILVVSLKIYYSLKPSTNRDIIQQESLELGPKKLMHVPVSQDNPLMGNPDAKVELVVFSDFNCPFCIQLYELIEEIKQDYILSGKVKFVFVNHPLLSKNNSLLLAKIAEAAYLNNSFWDVYPILFQQSSEFTKDNYADILLSNGIDTTNFGHYISSPEIVLPMIKDDLELAKTINVKGTPSFIINKTMYLGIKNKNEFVNLIEEELTKNGISSINEYCD